MPPIDLTGVPGISGLTLPEFSLAIRKPRLPSLPPLPAFPSFSANLPGLRPKIPRLGSPSLRRPGVNFLSVFRPQLPGVPDVLSIGGGIGVGPLCLELEEGENGPAASLNAVTDTIFPALNIGNLPEPFEALLNVEVNELCLDRAEKTFTADVRFPSTIEIIPSKPGFLSLTDTSVRVVVNASASPMQFDFSASSTTSLGRFPLDVAFSKTKGGSYSFAASPVSDTLTANDLATAIGSEELRNTLDEMQLTALTLSGLELAVFSDSGLCIRFTATVSYRELPSVSVELFIKRPFTSSASVAVGISTTSSTLAKIVSSLVPSIDISDVPLVGDLMVPAVAAVYTNATIPATPNIPFIDPELAVLGSSLLKTKFTFLFPLNLPRIGRKNFIGALKGLSFEFTVSCIEHCVSIAICRDLLGCIPE